MRRRKAGVMSKIQMPDEDLVAWRRQRLCAAGFAAGLADEVSRECGMDLHALLGLVDRGCPPDLAVRILAPLETEHRPC